MHATIARGSSLEREYGTMGGAEFVVAAYLTSHAEGAGKVQPTTKQTNLIIAIPSTYWSLPAGSLP